jgi:large subunit ribosomal protein L25
VAREVQRHPVRGEIIHLDFIRISMDEAIQAEVAIEFVGTPVGVREEGGIVDTVNTSLMISALPGAIPASIPAEIGEMGVGDTFTVAMLPEIDGVRYLAEPDTPLAVVTLPAAEIAAVSAEEGEEGEEAAGAEEGTGVAAAADAETGSEAGA